MALLLPALLGTVTACATGEDDEMARPTRTVTATPSTTLPPLAPDTVPVGRGAVRPDDVVWAQGSRLHVDDRVFDLSPRRVEQLVVVPGGVFFVEEGRLWFTDLAMVRDTGLTDVTSIATDAQGDGLVVTRGAGGGAGGRRLERGHRPGGPVRRGAAGHRRRPSRPSGTGRGPG